MLRFAIWLSSLCRPAYRMPAHSIQSHILMQMHMKNNNTWDEPADLHNEGQSITGLSIGNDSQIDFYDAFDWFRFEAHRNGQLTLTVQENGNGALIVDLLNDPPGPGTIGQKTVVAGTHTITYNMAFSRTSAHSCSAS